MNRLIDIFEQDLKYYFKFSGSKAESVDYHKQRAIGIMQRIAQAAYAANQEDVAKKAKSIADKYYSMYSK